MSVHGEKVQSSKVLPFFSPPELCDAGTNHDPMNMEPHFESRKSVEERKNESLPGNQSLIHAGLSTVRRDPKQSRQGAEGSQKMTEEDDCEEDNADCDDLGLRQFEGHCHPGPQHLSEEQPLSATVMSSQTTPQSRAEPTGRGLGESGQNREKGKEEVLFSFIKRNPANYVTLQLPKQDEIIYCEDCDRESQGDCPQHRHFQVQSSGVSSVRADPLCDPSCPDLTSPDLSRSLLTLDRGHVCRRCSASFIMFNSLKLHTLCIHGEKLLTALPPLSPPIPAAPDDGDGGSGNHDDMNEEPNDYDHQSFDSDERNVADGNSVHTRKDNKSYVTGNKFDVKKTNRQICDICFKSVTYLKTHKLTHTGYKEFKCSSL
ncbi:hypothetical protein ACOMHN_004159 [Nucella lapillus]